MPRRHARPGAAKLGESANGHADFPIQNLPFGVFRRRRAATPRGGVAIGDEILDLGARSSELVCFDGAAASAAGAAAGSAQRLHARSARGPRRALRQRALASCLREGARAGIATRGALAASMRGDCSMHLPAASATTPTSTPASTTRPTSAGCSGPTIRCCRTTSRCRSAITAAARRSVSSGLRFAGRAASASRATRDSARPSARRAASTTNWSSASSIGAGNALGDADSDRRRPRTISSGFCLLNDWSARDMQGWEYQPLGPVPGQELRHHDLAVDRDAGGAGAVPRRAVHRDPTAIPQPLPYLLDDRRPAQAARSTSSSRCCC